MPRIPFGHRARNEVYYQARRGHFTHSEDESALARSKACHSAWQAAQGTTLSTLFWRGVRTTARDDLFPQALLHDAMNAYDVSIGCLTFQVVPVMVGKRSFR